MTIPTIINNRRRRSSHGSSSYQEVKPFQAYRMRMPAYFSSKSIRMLEMYVCKYIHTYIVHTTHCSAMNNDLLTFCFVVFAAYNVTLSKSYSFNTMRTSYRSALICMQFTCIEPNRPNYIVKMYILAFTVHCIDSHIHLHSALLLNSLHSSSNTSEHIIFMLSRNREPRKFQLTVNINIYIYNKQ